MFGIHILFPFQPFLPVTLYIVSTVMSVKESPNFLSFSTLIKGIKRYGVPYMVMTDRGPQFVCKEFYDILQQKGIIHSMSRPHSPVDNRFIETFWKSMKIEIGKVNHLNVEQYLMIVDYYEYYYNYLRPHSSLVYLTPFNSRFNKIVI